MPKASEMILQVAGGLIAMAEDLYEKQNCLNLACTAWNLSLLPEAGREAAIEDCIQEYRRNNPGATQHDCDDLRHNYRVIIDHKIKKCPHSRTQMLKASINEAHGRHTVNVVSYDPDIMPISA
jgi:hypothetical protein